MATSGDWPIDAVWPNDDNPRHDIQNEPSFEGLVSSIRSQGILQPLLITEDGMILAGHRRFEAALVVGLHRVPVRVVKHRESNVLIPLIENLQRSDLGVLEAADYFRKCHRDHGMSVASISEATGVSPSTINKYIKLSEGPKEVRDRVERDEIPLTAAFELLRHDHDFVREVVNTPRLTREIVRERAQEQDRPTPRVVASPLFTMKPMRCPTEPKAHIEYAITAVRELLAASPNDDFSTRYKRWIRLMEDDLNDAEQIEPATFRGSVDTFQRQPKPKPVEQEKVKAS